MSQKNFDHSDQIDSITISLNGEERQIDDARLTSLLIAEGLDLTRPGIAVALNDRVIRRSTWESVEMASGDRIEVITALQGG